MDIVFLYFIDKVGIRMKVILFSFDERIVEGWRVLVVSDYIGKLSRVLRSYFRVIEVF